MLFSTHTFQAPEFYPRYGFELFAEDRDVPVGAGEIHYRKRLDRVEEERSMQIELETLATGYGLIEGPRVDAVGGLHFSDVHNGGVYRRDPDGSISVVVPKRRGVGGIVLHADGGVVVSGRNICHVKDGETRILWNQEDVGGYNDLFTDAEGGVWFGSLRSSPFDESRGKVMGELYHLHPDGRCEEVHGGVALTNGIGFSPDGKRVYHSDSVPRVVWCYEWDEEGTISRSTFAQLDRGGPDGLAVDEEGAGWVACYGGGCVLRYGSHGALLGEVDVPAKAITSLCFGGDDRRDLYIVTADNDDADLGGTIFRGRSPVAGLPVPLARV
ncbi:MAG: SMP-30/gluconolactonase/LRE family protein [Acidobacteriota bacterium]|nr:SMP-30/gluconolactonase/LRE family protein [Acidobacteriota bacterium]